MDQFRGRAILGALAVFLGIPALIVAFGAMVGGAKVDSASPDQYATSGGGITDNFGDPYGPGNLVPPTNTPYYEPRFPVHAPLCLGQAGIDNPDESFDHARANEPVGKGPGYKAATYNFGEDLTPEDLTPEVWQSATPDQQWNFAVRAEDNIFDWICTDTSGAQAVLQSLDLTWNPAAHPLKHSQMITKIWQIAYLGWQNPRLRLGTMPAGTMTYLMVPGNPPVLQATVYDHPEPRWIFGFDYAPTGGEYDQSLQCGGQPDVPHQYLNRYVPVV